MKFLLLGLSVFTLAQEQARPTIQDVKWIGGVWRGELGNATVEEFWTPPAGGAMLGSGRILSGGRMVMFEFLRIEERPDGLYYVAQPRGNPPTDFKLTRWTADEAVFENQQHDNPKLIRYRREADGSLIAETAGEQEGKPVKQRFPMKRVPITAPR